MTEDGFTPYDYRKLALESWFTDRSRSAISVVAYRTFTNGFDSSKLSMNPFPIHTDDAPTGLKATAHLLHGKLDARSAYLTDRPIPLSIPLPSTDFVSGISHCPAPQTLEGCFLLIVTPHTVDGNMVDDNKIVEAHYSLLSLCLAMLGEGIAFERSLSLVLWVEGDQREIHPSLWKFPRRIEFGNEDLSAVSQCADRLSSLPDNDRNRVALALRWYEAGVRDSGVDAFLKYWIAVETLAMEDTTNIKPVKERVGKIYNIDPKEADDTFGIGRVLYRLRVDIVHNGKIDPPGEIEMRRIKALFVDLLLDFLDLPSLRRLEAVNNQNKVR